MAAVSDASHPPTCRLSAAMARGGIIGAAVRHGPSYNGSRSRLSLDAVAAAALAAAAPAAVSATIAVAGNGHFVDSERRNVNCVSGSVANGTYSTSPRPA